MNPIRTIVVPYDFSDHAAAALDLATDLAVQLDAELHLVHILQPPAYGYSGELYAGGPLHALVTEQRDAFHGCEQRLADVAEGLTRSPHPPRTHVVEGTRIAECVDQEAERLGADLIVMGTHGRTGLAHLLMGSVAEATLRKAPCPVLTVPRRPHAKRARQMEPLTGARIPSGVI